MLDMQEMAKEHESLMVKTQRAEEVQLKEEKYQSCNTGERGQPWEGELKARKMISHREAGNKYMKWESYISGNRQAEGGRWLG